jgi:hypothetical protein
MADQRPALARELTTPRAAACAGIIFAVLLVLAVASLHEGLPANADPVQWLRDTSHRHSVALAMSLVPYAGIAFLWFIGVIRTRLGDREDRLFATAFLGSGLLFVATLFTAAATVGALLSLYSTPGLASPGNVRFAASLASILLGTFGIRMAAVFTLVVTNIGRRTGVIPKWLIVIGYLTALLLLLSPPRTAWATLLFPCWVFLFSLDILVKSFRGGPTLSAD